MYFSGQGKLLIATRGSNGQPGLFRWVGNVPELKMSLTVENIDHFESHSGQRLQDLHIIKSKKVDLQFTLEDFTMDNLAFVLFGTKGTLAAATVTNETMPTGAAVGDIYRTAKPKISAVTVKDSAGSPATLVLDTDYAIHSADHGSIEILNLGSYVQPFKVDYTAAVLTNKMVQMFEAAQQEYFLRFEGLNTANSDAPVLVEIYRCLLDPIKEMGMINDELMRMDISGAGLYDNVRTYDANLGYFGRVVQLS